MNSATKLGKAVAAGGGGGGGGSLEGFRVWGSGFRRFRV